MRDFELTVLFRPDVDDLAESLDKVKRIITYYGGEIVKEENDGTKRLAYNIQGYEHAIYYFFVLNLPSETIGKICNTLNINDNILRYLLVTVDHRREKCTEDYQTQTA